MEATKKAFKVRRHNYKTTVEYINESKINFINDYIQSDRMLTAILAQFTKSIQEREKFCAVVFRGAAAQQPALH